MPLISDITYVRVTDSALFIAALKSRDKNAVESLKVVLTAKEIDVLRAIDYMAFELHSHLFGPDVKQLYNDALATLEETHDCQRDEFYFWARKKH